MLHTLTVWREPHFWHLRAAWALISQFVRANTLCKLVESNFSCSQLALRLPSGAKLLGGVFIKVLTALSSNKRDCSAYLGKCSNWLGKFPWGEVSDIIVENIALEPTSIDQKFVELRHGVRSFLPHLFLNFHRDSYFISFAHNWVICGVRCYGAATVCVHSKRSVRVLR